LYTLNSGAKSGFSLRLYWAAHSGVSRPPSGQTFAANSQAELDSPLSLPLCALCLSRQGKHWSVLPNPGRHFLIKAGPEHDSAQSSVESAVFTDSF
jgi:hypothetical protein